MPEESTTTDLVALARRVNDRERAHADLGLEA